MDPEIPMTELPAEGDVFAGKYRIGSILGIGGMAAVMEAKHLGFDETVALKTLLPDCNSDPEVVRRFLQEGRAAIKIRSEHVVRMLDVGVASGRAYLVMEYLDGRDFKGLLRKMGPLPPPMAIDLLLQACEAIGEAHALGIIHRDLKPANLFLTHRPDGTACVKVLDFGISKVPREVSGALLPDLRPTLPSVVMGSPQYMSPEQMASAAAADQQSDIWSLGAILYELLTGRIAFDGATTAEICARVLKGAPTPLQEIRPEVSREVVEIVSKCLEKARARRYANVAELARALAPCGSPDARSSAETIARIIEGASSARHPSMRGSPTTRPTAVEILERAPTERRGVSGSFVGSLLAIAALGIAGMLVRGASAAHGWSTSAPATSLASSAAPFTVAPSDSPPPSARDELMSAQRPEGELKRVTTAARPPSSVDERDAGAEDGLTLPRKGERDDQP